MIKQFPLAGKERKFKNVKMYQIMDLQENWQNIMNDPKIPKTQDKYVKVGELIAELIEPFDPKEMLEIEPDEFIVLQQLNLIYTLAKTKCSKSEMEDLMEQIKKASVEGQLSVMRNPVAFQLGL